MCRTRLASIPVLTASLGALVGVATAAAQPAYDRLTIIAPAAPGGGWDQTARAMQHALEADGLVRTVLVENVPGAAGTIGLAQFVTNRQGDENTLLVTGLVMVGAIVFNDSPASLVRTTPIARLTGEFEVIAVPASSAVTNLHGLVERLRANPGAVSWGGGSAGGTDHILAGLIAEAAGVDARRVNYVAFSGGGEAVAALLGSQVTAGISGYCRRGRGLGPISPLPSTAARDRPLMFPIVSARANQIEPPSSSAGAPRRRPVNASRWPSGLQRGADPAVAETFRAGSEMRRGGALPSAATIQSSPVRRFSASTIVVRTKATHLPSGDIAGACTVTTR